MADENLVEFDAAGFGITTLDYICVVDKLANYQKHAVIQEVKFFGGGCVSTALAALNRLGGTSSLITMLGDDWVAKEVLQGLKKESIDFSGISIAENQLTTFSFVQVSNKIGKRAISFYPGSGGNLKFDAKAQKIVKSSRMLIIDGLIKSECIKAAKFAKDNRIKVMLDCNVVNVDTENLLPYVDFLITSESFLYDYARTRNIEKALKKLHRKFSPEVLVTTLGKKGSVALINDRIKHVDIFDVKVKDTTGCGDVYHGAFMYGLLRNWDTVDIMIFSTAVSSIKSMYFGGRPGIPDLKKTLEFLGNRGIDVKKFILNMK